MAEHKYHFIVNRFENKEIEAHLDRMLEQYQEGTAEGDDLKAHFDAQSMLHMRDEETVAKFQERCAFLASCYASRSFPPAREELKRHMLSMLTAATRDVLGVYGVCTEPANGDGHAVLDTGRAAVFNMLERVVKDRVDTVNDAAPSSLIFYRDAPPSDWAEASQLGSFLHDKQANDADLRREMALVETLDVGEDIKHLMRTYLTRAGTTYTDALRYYHTASLFNTFRRHADNYVLLLFYSYKVKDKEVRGLQYNINDGDYIEGFGGR